MNNYYGMAGIEDMLQEILDFGAWIPNERTGVMTKVLFDGKITIFDDFPFVTNNFCELYSAIEAIRYE